MIENEHEINHQFIITTNSYPTKANYNLSAEMIQWEGFHI